MNSAAAIIGTTTWGTTLGVILARRHIPVTLMARTAEEAARLNSARENRRFLPGIPFPDCLTVDHDAARGVAPAKLVILAVPSDRFRRNVQQVAASLSPEATILSVSKGLELAAGKRMSQVLEEELPPPLRPNICVMSGPNLALEVAQEKPSATVVAGKDGKKTAYVQELLMSSSFRVYTSDDVTGVEMGGTLKNIIALGAGISDGLDLGQNSKSAFITRGLAEITRLGIAAGAQPTTFAVVAGKDGKKTAYVQELLMSSSFRVYTSDDVTGVEMGGTLKNIIALGAGISDGLDLGQNSKSAFITRGLAEITRLGIAAGAQPTTFAGLAGLGDLVATCYSQLSRNRYVGEQLTQGRTWADIRAGMQNVVEGVNTTGAALAMAEKLNVEMPIAHATYRVLFEDLPPREAIAELMGRPPHSEH